MGRQSRARGEREGPATCAAAARVGFGKIFKRGCPISRRSAWAPCNLAARTCACRSCEAVVASIREQPSPGSRVSATHNDFSCALHVVCGMPRDRAPAHARRTFKAACMKGRHPLPDSPAKRAGRSAGPASSVARPNLSLTADLPPGASPRPCRRLIKFPRILQLLPPLRPATTAAPPSTRARGTNLDTRSRTPQRERRSGSCSGCRARICTVTPLLSTSPRLSTNLRRAPHQRRNRRGHRPARAPPRDNNTWCLSPVTCLRRSTVCFPLRACSSTACPNPVARVR